MAENIAKRKERLFIDIQNKGLLDLRQELDDDSLKQLLNNVIIEDDLTKSLANFYNEHGVICESSRLRRILKELKNPSKQNTLF
ncbi:MAG: hypothetical protein FWE37_05045 [Spirochaetaceae bacterium]|nr:hypothetical protein [Spirochaetaceae bacterium]